jgi:hypothetical protein
MVEPEQVVNLLAVPAKSACKLRSGDAAFAQDDGELNLEDGKGRQLYEPGIAARRLQRHLSRPAFAPHGWGALARLLHSLPITL